MARGKFIIIDGTDGSGKATQTRLLIKRLAKAGHKIRVEDFPQYGKKSAGPVEDYLGGIYGRGDELGAYIPSIFFAVDRFAAAKRIRAHLAKGYVVISNRYVTANMAHQGGKIKNPKEREKYFKWLDELEYRFFKIPKPDLHIILHIPPDIAIKLIRRRGPMYYIGKPDIHETDIKHLRAAEQIYLQISKKFGYPIVSGFVDQKLLSPEEISDEVFRIAQKYLKGRK